MREVERYIAGRLEPAELCHGGPASDMTRKVAVVLASDYDALAAENARLRAELAEVKGRGAVATIEQREPYEDGTPHPCKTLRWAGNNAEDDFPAGTKLYASQPAATSEAQGHTSEAAPGVAGLVKALEATLRLDRGTSGRIILEADDEEVLRAALSTWRQAQEGKP